MGLPGEDGRLVPGPPGPPGDLGPHGPLGHRGPQGETGETGITGEDWDGKKQGDEMIMLGNEMLHKVDTLVQTHDESASILLEQMKMLERQLGMEVKDLHITQDDLNAQQDLMARIARETEMLKGYRLHATEAIGGKEMFEAGALQELQHAEQAQLRYQHGMFAHDGYSDGGRYARQKRAKRSKSGALGKTSLFLCPGSSVVVFLYVWALSALGMRPR
uniref:Uncharacterized protein n=1 Tax=Alexandrium andersonii TaxID=327968 RepID=A0A7S2HQY8_9DINO